MKRIGMLLLWAGVLASCIGPNRPHCSLPEGKAPRSCAHEARLEWRSFDGERFPYRCWPDNPPRHPRAVVIMACGWDEVSCDFAPLAERLAREGYAVYASENRGGSYDPDVKNRGDTRDRLDWVRHLQAFTAFVRRRHPGVPFYYHGHSLGTIVVIEAVSHPALPNRAAPQPAGLILQSPAIALMQKQEHKLLRGFLWLFSEARIKHLQRDPREAGIFDIPERTCEWALSDDRVRAGYKVRFALNAAALGHEARLDSSQLQMPVLVLAGGKDGLVSLPVVGVSRDEYVRYMTTEIAGGLEDSPGGHTHFVYYPNGCHVLTDGLAARQAIPEVVRWLARHPARACLTSRPIPARRFQR